MTRFTPPQVLTFRLGLRATAWLLLVVWLPPAIAATQEPQIMVREIFDELLTRLHEHEPDAADNNAGVRDIFVSLLSPHIAYQTLARWILRDHWVDSSADQQAAFIVAFEHYIISTYALALSSGQAIQLDIADEPVLGKNTAVVTAAFKFADADAVPLDFRLIQRNEEWLLFDVSFSGVSLARTFRADFNYVAKDGGIDAVTEHLERRRAALLE
ncbi:MAG: ABC transporter substrate-binding protein [Proteobacteria bacterium]|nr:MAG: ABC transporter substrate-binding protein [Pseudomonadota bacterium]